MHPTIRTAAFRALSFPLPLAGTRARIWWTERHPCLTGRMLYSPRTLQVLAYLATCALAIAGANADAQVSGVAPPARSVPLPLDVVASLRSHNTRSPIALSPDGKWLAHSIATADRVVWDSLSVRYTASGVPLAEGDARMEVTVSSANGSEVIRVGAAGASSWAAVWSPRGDQLAFYSDEGGTAGLWIWSPATRERRRIAGLTVRPFFGFESAEWTSDGQRIVVKVLPQGVSIAQANASDPRARGPWTQTIRFPAAREGDASVIVRRAAGANAPAAGSAETSRMDSTASVVADELAIVDLRSDAVRRVVTAASLRTHALSPDGRHLAFTVAKGREVSAMQPIYDIELLDLSSGERRKLATGLRMSYGIEWSWSPDSRSIATISGGQLARGEITIVDVHTRAPRVLGGGTLPSFNPGDGEEPPIWSADGRHLYGIADASLWRVDAATGAGTRIGQLEGWRFRTLVWPRGRPVLWTTDGGRRAWVLARATGTAQSAIVSVDLSDGTSRIVNEEARAYSGAFNVTASDATQEIAFVASGQRHLPELWTFSTSTTRLRQASRINPAVNCCALGATRVIEWRTSEGRTLRGALLLPPDYSPGRRLPLVVWVYGGSMGSAAVNQFGLVGMGPLFNMQVLATRGYAVLFPDAPLRTGSPAADIFSTVMPGVDAAIAQGFADPDRLAVMGQSYGSYNVLALITQTTRFKAAIITGNVLHPNLAADYLGNVGYYERGQGNMGGSLWEFPERYRDNSPIFKFDKIVTAVLMGQGERDGNLVPAEAIFTALQRLGKPVEYRLYEGEGHVISRAENVIDFWERRLEFLAEHLGMR